MKITIETKVFKSAVKKLNNIACKSTLNILDEILFTRSVADAKTVTMTAYDFETYHSIVVPCTCDADGTFEFTITCAKLQKLASCMTEDAVVLNFDSGLNRIDVDFGTKVKFDSKDTKDFPIFDWTSDDAKSLASVYFDGVTLQDAIEHTVWTTSKDDHRKVLQGVCFDIDTIAKSVNVIATDGKKLAVFKCKPTWMATDGYSGMYVMPKKAAEQLLTCDAPCKFIITGKHIMVYSGNDCIITKKIEGCYPNYNRVVPREFAYHINFDKAQMLKDCKQVIKVGKTLEWDKFAPYVTFTFGDQIAMQHKSKSGDDTVEFEHISKCKYDGNTPSDWWIKFDVTFIQDILDSDNNDCVAMFNEHDYDKYTGRYTSHPVMFRFSDTYFVIIMPVQVR